MIAADDPSNPTGAEVHVITQVHEAVDLAAEPGDCVFAARRAALATPTLRVVSVETGRSRLGPKTTIRLVRPG